MVRGSRGWSKDDQTEWELRSNLFVFHRLSPWILVVFIFSLLVKTTRGSLFRSLFDVPERCGSDDNGIHACTFLFSCYYEKGNPLRSCGGGFLYTCCEIPVATVRSDLRNEIAPYSLYSESTASKPRVRSFSRGRIPHIFGNRPSKNLPRIPLPPEPEIPKSVISVPAFVQDVDKLFLKDKDKFMNFPSISYEPHYNEAECGIQKAHHFAKRIIGGNEARFAELPWQAHIRISGYQCGGVLLNRYFIATAAHCVHKAGLNQISVYLGEYDTKDTGKYYEPYPREVFAVVAKRTHPLFKYMLTQPDRYDVAVLRLSRPVTYRQNIIPICLPSPTDDFEGSVGIVAGWGKTDTSFGKTGTNILRKVTVPVINNRECFRWHHSKGIDVKLYYEMFCAGHSDGKMDACLGDSGGPLVIHHRGRWRLAGITSAGFGCAVDHQPGIYHKVSVTAGWIADNIKP